MAPMPGDDQDGPPERSRIRRSWLTLGAFRVNPWLVALTALLIVAAVAFSGPRISDADNAGAGYQQVHQLADLGDSIAGVHGMASAMEDEEDSLAAYIGAGRPKESLIDLQAHYAITNLQEVKVQTLADAVSTGFPSQVRADVAQVLDDIHGLKNLRQTAQGPGSNVPAQTVLGQYTSSVNQLLALNDQIAATSGDPQLAADVQALDALSRAEDAAAQERSILDAVLARGSWQPGEALALINANAQDLANIAEFKGSVPTNEYQTYVDSVSGPLANTAGQIMSQALFTGQAGVVPGLPKGSPATTAATAWFGGQTFIIDHMRVFEENILDSIQSRSQTLQNQETQTVTETWIETAGFLAVVVAIVVVAAWRSSPSRRIHWI